MTSILLGLNTAVQGLMAAQAEIATASNNIDNAATPGYSRQVVNLQQSPATGSIGTGVQVSSITRARDSFLDSQYRDQNQALSQSQSVQTTLDQVTAIINEPSNTGISNALQQFWSSWDTLQSNPGDMSARTQVQQSATTLTQTMNQTASQLSQLQTNVQQTLSTSLTQANTLISQIASVTHQIQLIQRVGGAQPNELMDQRDQLIDQLSSLGNVTVTQPTTVQSTATSGPPETMNMSGLQATNALSTPLTLPANASISVMLGSGSAVKVNLNPTGSPVTLNTPADVVNAANAGLQAAGLGGQVTAAISPSGNFQFVSPSSQTVAAKDITPSTLSSLGFTGPDAVTASSLTVEVSATAPIETGYQVSFGGVIVVADGQSTLLNSTGTSANTQIQAAHFNLTTQQFDTTQVDTIHDAGGSVQGTIDSMGDVQNYQNSLDTLAQALAGVPPTAANPTGVGAMNVTLQGSWTVPVGNFQTSGTLPDGTSFDTSTTLNAAFASAHNLTAVTDSSGLVVGFNVPTGAKVNVYGINGLERLGYGENGPGQDFFVPNGAATSITAATITVGVTPAQIAAGTSLDGTTGGAKAGDGTLAAAINALKGTATTFPDPSNPSNNINGTLDGYLNRVVGQLGIQSQTANNNVANGQALVQQVNALRQSVSGVSMDEEMANVVKAQQAYSASAKLVSVIDQMLQTLMQNV